MRDVASFLEVSFTFVGDTDIATVGAVGVLAVEGFWATGFRLVRDGTARITLERVFAMVKEAYRCSPDGDLEFLFSGRTVVVVVGSNC